MTNPLHELLKRRPTAILDGALATELEGRGAVLDTHLWSARLLADRPELIRAVHLDYLRAGADIVTTASYQATIAGFARAGFVEAEARRLLRRSVELARAACHDAAAGGAPALVAASIGCYGAALADGSEFTGAYDVGEAALMDHHQPQLEALVDAAPDLIAFETIPRLDEALACARLLESAAGACGWISVTCRDERSTRHGEPIEDVVRALDRFERVAAIGVNCTHPAHVEGLLRRAREHTSKPLIVYPSSGETWRDRRWQGSRDPGGLAREARAWTAAGARVIGGCCRITPAHIAALRAALS
jgi:homocysteine S-methyltransferase